MENFWIPEDNFVTGERGPRPIDLQQYQIDCLREALRKDEDGNFIYSTIVWSDIKKSAKSTIAGGVALWVADTRPWAEVFLIANDLKQADMRVAKYARRAVMDSPYLKERFKPLRNHIKGLLTNSIVEPIPIDPSGEAGSNADMIQFCLDEETEILTKDGWKHWPYMFSYDQIATQNPKTGEFEWQEADGWFLDENYSGEMWEFESTRMSMKITPNHRVYGKFSGKGGAGRAKKGHGNKSDYLNLDWELKPIEEALEYRHFWVRTRSNGFCGDYTDYVTIPSTGYQEEIHVDIELWAQFMGWYLSEGCISKKHGKPQGINIGQSKKINPEYYREILNMFLEMGLNPREHKNNESITVYNSKLAEMLVQFGLSGDKYIDSWLKNQPKEILEIFLDAYIKGDGYSIGEGIAISTKSLLMCNDLQEVAQKCGYGVAYWKYADSRWKGSPVIYTVKLTPSNTTREIKANPKRWKKVHYDGAIWCPSTKNGIIYVRRNGKCYWTGNSELWGAMEEQKGRMYSEMTLSPTKYGKSFRWIESYAGYVEESELLYSLYERGVKDGQLIWPDRLYPVTNGEPAPIEAYSNGRLFCLWNTLPRCPWQTPEYYVQETEELIPSEFQRMHRNQWVRSTDTFVPIEWWDACVVDQLPVPIKDQPMILTLDAAVSDDTFGLLMCGKHPLYYSDDEAISNAHAHYTVIYYAQKWDPPPGRGRINFRGTEESPGPELMLIKLAKEYNIVGVAYDEYQLHDFSTRLHSETGLWFRRFPQGGGRHGRLVADSDLRDKIRERRIIHNGNVDLREHIQNAEAKIDTEDRKVRIVKRTKKLKVDLAVCLSMGSYEVHRLNI